MSGKHTETPWQVNDTDSSQICDSDGEKRGCAPIATMHGTYAEKIANAKFIVRACNAHDDLLEALIAFRNGGPMGGQDFEGWHQSYLPAIEKARAAIRKATGEKE